MTTELFNDIVSLFKERYLIINNGKSQDMSTEKILNMASMNLQYNPFNWMLDLFKINDKIISKFSNVNIQWVDNYISIKQKNDPSIPLYFPDIFVDFKNYVDSLISEEYLKCNLIKDKIFNTYKL